MVKNSKTSSSKNYLLITDSTLVILVVDIYLVALASICIGSSHDRDDGAGSSPHLFIPANLWQIAAYNGKIIGRKSHQRNCPMTKQEFPKKFKVFTNFSKNFQPFKKSKKNQKNQKNQKISKNFQKFPNFP
jgi:hypothetical protein